MSCSDAVNLVDEPDPRDNIALREPAGLDGKYARFNCPVVVELVGP